MSLYSMRLYVIWLAFPLGLTLPTHGWSSESVPHGYRAIANEFNIPPKVLYAVALAESGRSDSAGNIRPWPWTLNVQGRGYFYASRREAWRALRRFMEEGNHSVDIGLMQVNWRYHQTKLVDPWLALDPYHNLRVAAEILRRCYEVDEGWWSSVGCYHSPQNGERAMAYSRRVEKHWMRLAAAG